ncbi:methyl-accepting chemotaxis protein [Fodinisporobacter ferrooxydans]|uniref:Methyl-accepting chemotaxis protein n=1 Tax=Fodinisporobacter ferrooxydans TaxID=2901836 RepID=A0ABY4CMT0_9BACL|nr:methyl-accepting chemotaxis protein [Alicyclobacillaceae bacterium MYW30-H2]
MAVLARFFTFKSLRTELIIICLLILAIPSIIIGILGYETAKSELDKSGKIQLINDVRLVNSTIGELNKEVEAGRLPLQVAQERVKEMILGPKDASGKRPINHAFNLGANGYFFVFDKHATEIAHPTLEGKNLWNMKSVDGVMIGQEIVKQALINHGGFTYYSFPLPNSKQIAPKIVYSEKAPAWGWIVCAGSYLQDYNSGAAQVLYILLITLGVSIIVGLAVVWLIAKRITTPIVAMANQADLVAKGDLTIEPMEIKHNNEIGRLSKDFRIMIQNLKDLISRVNTNTQQLTHAAGELFASSEQTSKASEQIATTMQEISSGSEKQAGNVDEIAHTLNQTAREMHQIVDNSKNVSQSATEASEITAEGNTAIHKAIYEMNSIHGIVSELADSVKILGEHSQMIGTIVNTITNISSQTNLLALNAAIEAARAGEHGRGFAVVADEVRKLAEQSTDSAKQIGNLIGTIQNEIAKVVQATDKGTQEVQVGIEAVNLAGRAFEKIQESVSNVAARIQEATTAVYQISAGTEQAVRAIDKIGEVTGATVSSTQTVSASIEEQLAYMEEITASANSLSIMAEELKQLVSHFNI